MEVDFNVQQNIYDDNMQLEEDDVVLKQSHSDTDNEGSNAGRSRFGDVVGSGKVI